MSNPALKEPRKKDSLWIGFVAGIVLPVVSFFLIYVFTFSDQIEITSFLRQISDLNVVSEFVSLSGIPNLILFFYFIRNHSYQNARGVILATFILAAIVIILNTS